MNKILVGLNLPGSTSIGNFDKALTTIEEDGFDACEINLSTFPMIIGGEIKPVVVDYVKEIMGKHNLVYTAHIGYGLDMRNLEKYDLHRQVLFSSIEVCAELGIYRLNVHYEEESLYQQKERQFIQSHIDAAEYAQSLGVELVMENVEVEHASKVIALVKETNHPNFGLTIDLGHLFIACQTFGTDYFELLEEALPLLRHIHINDNTGDFEMMRLENHVLYNTLNRGQRFAFGRGDIHIPPFWGKAPLKEALTRIKKSGYQGIWMCEYYSENFAPFNKGVQEAVRKHIEQS